MSARPLEGLTVLDLSRLLPGPFATLLLADLGATIVKIEPPRGGDYARWFPPSAGGTSGLFAALNRNKQGLVLNLKAPDGPALLKRLVADADILIESFRPGVMDRLGVGYEALRAVNPRLIYCAISGFGQTGPLAQRAGHDLGYLALSGLLGVSGAQGQAQQPGFQAADVAGGSLYGVIGILAALHQRTRTGEGQLVDVSMTDGAAGLGVMMHAKQHLDGQPIGPGTDELAGSRPCYRVYRCADGKQLAVGALEPKFWSALCTAIGVPHLISDGLATGDRGAAVIAELDALFGTRTRDDWVDHLADFDVCVEPVLQLDEVAEHPLATHAGWFGTHGRAEGETTWRHQYPNPRLLPAAPPPAATPAPTLGADTRAVLARAGLTADEVEALFAAGVVA